MKRPGDCLATAIAAMLGIDSLELPHTGADDWDAAWAAFRSALAARGWRISFTPWTGPNGSSLAQVLAACESQDEIERAYLWVISVTHPSFLGRDGKAESHVIVCRGSEIAFDPGGDATERPPLSELEVDGFFTLAPIDPALFALRR